MAHEIPDPLPFEDSAVRFAARVEESNRTLPRKFVKATYVLLDGPNAGETVEFLREEIATTGAAGGGLTDAELRATPVPVAIDQTGDNNNVDLNAGTANVGIIRTIPTSGRVIDSVDGTTVITVKTAAGLANTSGDNVVLAAVAGKKIRVLSYALQIQSTDAQTIAAWQDNATATQRGMRWMLTGTADGTSQQGVVRNPGDGSHFYFETAEGVGLDLNLSAVADVAWEITYVEVD